MHCDIHNIYYLISILYILFKYKNNICKHKILNKYNEKSNDYIYSNWSAIKILWI